MQSKMLFVLVLLQVTASHGWWIFGGGHKKEPADPPSPPLGAPQQVSHRVANNYGSDFTFTCPQTHRLDMASIGATTTMSKDAWGGKSQRAVDGNTDTNYGHSSCTHTARNKNVYWRVDLKQTYRIQQIKIWNRNGYWDRLNGANVYVTDGSHKWLCGTIAGITAENKDLIIELNCDLRGRYVRIEQPANYLTLCEVQVYVEGGPLTGAHDDIDLALEKRENEQVLDPTGTTAITTMSSTYAHGDRQWSFTCSVFPGEANKCQWSDWTNDKGGEMDYTCPLHFILTGMKSHRVGKDRLYAFQCCYDVREREMCYTTGYKNMWARNLKYSVPSLYIMRGVHSIYQASKQDRRWKFHICELDDPGDRK